jgi:hypothetical protein
LAHEPLIGGELGLFLLLAFKVVNYHIKVAQDLIIIVICFIYLFGDFVQIVATFDDLALFLFGCSAFAKTLVDLIL